MNKDRSLLFGLLAVSMKKVRQDKMSEVARRTENDPDFDLGKSLVEAGLLSAEDRRQIDSLVEMSLAEHNGDASRTIQAFGKDPNKLASMVDSMDNFIDAFEKNSSKPDFSSGADSAVADSLLGGVGDMGSIGGPVELDSLVENEDPLKTRITQSGNTGDRGSIGNVGLDAPDSFFQSVANTDTQIMSPVQAAAEIDESEIVPAVAEHQGRYETIREFAKGGMGQITLVHDTHLGRDIALKQLLQRNILPETRPGAPTTAILTIPIIARFLQEARITGQLEHPSIIPVYELGYRKDGSLYYTMKLVRGRSMHDVLKDAKDIRERMAMLPHFLNLCHAISYAHSRGVIHRDLKPMNLMIGEFGETVVIDWGIAKVKGQDDIHAKGLQETVHAMRLSSAEATAKTMYGQTIGSPYFMPAEQAMGRTDLIDERSDIYSLGAVLYVILTGQMPYAGNNVREFMGKVGQVEPKPVLALEPQAPKELAAVVKKAMALVPENRYQSAKELTTEIANFLSGQQVSAYEYSMVEIVKRYYKKHKTRINTIAAASVLGLIGAVYSYFSILEQKNIALANEKEAKRQEGIAKVNEEEAKKQTGIAVTERDRAEQELYYANVANTRFNINEQQMAKARELLAHCKPELREWEWGFLSAETHADILTVDRGGRFSEFTGDGAGLITGTARGTVSRYDLATGKLAHDFTDRVGFNYAVAGSGDLSRIAVMEDSAVHVWDAASGEELFRAEMPEKKLTKYLMALSANGKFVAGLPGDQVLRVWEVDSGKEVAALEDCQPNGFNVFFLSPDGSKLFVARRVLGENGLERRFEVLAIPGGEPIGTEVFPEDSVLSVHTAAFSPDGRLVAVGTDNDLQIWDLDEFKKVGEVQGERFGHPDEIAFSPDGAYVAAGTKDGDLLLYDVKAAKVRAERAKGHENFIRSVRFTHDGTRVGSVADDRTVRLWSVPGLQPLHTYKGHDLPVYTLGFSQDDTRMASSSPTDKTKVWDISADLEFAPTELDNFKSVVYDRASGLVAGAVKDSVLVWDARTGHRAHELAAPGEASKALAFNPEGTLIASVVWDGNAEVLRAWDRATGEEKLTFPTGQTATRAVHFINGDSQILLYTGSDLLRFDTSGQSAGSVFADNPAAADKTLGSYEVSAEGDRLVAGFKGEGNIATALHLPLAGEGAATRIDFQNVSGVSGHFAPDSGRILVCQTEVSGSTITGAAIAYWNLADNTLGELARRHENAVLAVDYSRDGTMLATGDRNGVAALWDAATLEPGPLLQGHAGSINHMDFSPNGKRLVTGSADLTFKIWDVSGGVQLLTVNDAAVKADLQVPVVEQVTFSEDGLQLATLTSPPVSPMILHAFSTNTADYPEVAAEGDSEEAATPEAQNGDAAAPADAGDGKAALEQFERRMEAYKRAYWK